LFICHLVYLHQYPNAYESNGGREKSDKFVIIKSIFNRKETKPYIEKDYNAKKERMAIINPIKQ
jgi:hypothetical protein